MSMCGRLAYASAVSVTKAPVGVVAHDPAGAMLTSHPQTLAITLSTTTP